MCIRDSCSTQSSRPTNLATITPSRIETKLTRFKDWEGDFEAREKYIGEHKEPNILYKEELADGSRITSINLSGSQFDFEYMLEHCKYNIMLIQEHWRLNKDLESWKSLAHPKGWQGVWEVAKQTETNGDGVTGRSGGVAILAWNVRLVLKSEFEADHRVVGATL
eukprot:7689678-Heterocapsa_arctica.AAC.1